MSTGPAQGAMFGQAAVGKVRNANQCHFTPLPLARIVIAMLAERLPRDPDVFVEPSCGDGGIVIAARERWPDALIIGVDIDERARGLRLCDVAIVGDWPTVARWLLWKRLGYPGALVAVSGNPPFKASTDAETAEVIAHVRAAIELGDHTVLILPFSFRAGSPKWGPIMKGANEAIDAGNISPRPWPVTREPAAFYWRDRTPEDRPGTNVFRLPRWRRP